MTSSGIFAYTVIGLLFGTIFTVFAMKYFSAAYAARTRVKSDEAYRELAQRAALAQSESAASLAAMKTELAAISERLSSVEKILKAVE